MVYAKSVVMFMIYLHTKFQMYSCNFLLVIPFVQTEGLKMLVPLF